HLCDGRPDRRFLRRFPHPAGPADPPGEHVRPASPVHAAGRHADDSGGRHVPGLCPDPHRHGDQRGRETEARTVPGRVLGGDHLVGGLRRNRAGSAGGDEPGAVCGHRAGGGRACHQRKGIREDHRDLRLPVQPRDRLFRGHPVLLPADGPDAVRQRH
ncbi:putative conserved protein, partial [Dysosmobacter welbionis]